MMNDSQYDDDTKRSECPSEAALAAMLHSPTIDDSGEPPDTADTPHDITAIAEHVDACPRCQEILEHLTRVPAELESRGDVTAHGILGGDATINEVLDQMRLRPPTERVALDLDRARTIATNIDDFDTVELIGSGGSGVLFRARHKRLGRDVAIKIWPSTSLADATTRNRVDREAQALAKLDDPHVVRVFDYGTTADGAAYLVMEYVNGKPLSSLIRQLGALSPRRSASLVRDVAHALESAHQMGLIHRDIKPANILLQSNETNNESHGAPRDRIKLVDFGLVLDEGSEHSLTLEGAFAGTPYYMSPEQIEDAHRVDCRADVYSLGVVLYELLTATRPFQGVMRMVLHQALHEDPVEPRKRDDSIPIDLETVCLKAMAKEPQQRYATAAEFSDDLTRWLEHKPILARRPSFFKKMTSWSRHNPQTAGMVVSIAALLLVLGIGGPLASLRIARARDAAEKLSYQMAAQRNQALATLHTMVFDIPDYLSKEEISFEEIEQSVLLSALRGLEDVADWPQETELQQDTAGAVAVAHARLAGAYYWSDENETAREHAHRAIDVATEALNTCPNSAHLRQADSLAHWFLANMAWEDENVDAAIVNSRLSLDADRIRLRYDPTDNDARHDLLATSEFLIDILLQQGELEAAKPLVAEALSASRELIGGPEYSCAEAHVAHNLTSKGRIELELGAIEASQQSYQRALEHLDRSELGRCIDLPLTIADCCQKLAGIAMQQGNDDAAQSWRDQGNERLDELRRQFQEEVEGIDEWFGEAKSSLGQP